MTFVAILSRVFIKSKVYRHQILALTSIFIGIGLVGISTILNSDDSQSTDNDGRVVIGFVLLIICSAFQRFSFRRIRQDLYEIWSINYKWSDGKELRVIFYI